MTISKDETLHTATLGLKHKIMRWGRKFCLFWLLFSSGKHLIGFRSDFGHGKIVTVKCVASIYDIYYKMVETRILRDKKNRRIIKMDKNKINNNKYTYLVESDDYDDKSSEGTLFIYKYNGFKN